MCHWTIESYYLIKYHTFELHFNWTYSSKKEVYPLNIHTRLSVNLKWIVRGDRENILFKCGGNNWNYNSTMKKWISLWKYHIIIIYYLQRNVLNIIKCTICAASTVPLDLSHRSQTMLKFDINLFIIHLTTIFKIPILYFPFFTTN